MEVTPGPSVEVTPVPSMAVTPGPSSEEIAGPSVEEEIKPEPTGEKQSGAESDSIPYMDDMGKNILKIRNLIY